MAYFDWKHACAPEASSSSNVWMSLAFSACLGSDALRPYSSSKRRSRTKVSVLMKKIASAANVIAVRI